MLKFLAPNRGSDHPLADPKKLEQSIRTLPADAARAIDEIIGWLETVRTHEAFTLAQRAEAMLAIDAAAQIPARKLARELETARGNKFQMQRLLGTLKVYSRETAEALSVPIEAFARGAKGADAVRRDIPQIVPRALRAWANLARWLALQYSPLDESGWTRAYMAYAVAEQLQIARKPVQPYPRVPAETTPERELLQLVVFAGSVPSALDAHSILILDRVVNAFAPQFELLPAAQPGTHQFVDLASGQPPARVNGPGTMSPTLRFVSGVSAMRAVETLIGELLVSNVVPDSLGLEGRSDAADLVRILQGFGVQWAATVPGRRAQRRPIQVRLTVAWGYEGLISVLVSLPAVGQMLDFSAESPVETWVTEEVGAGGFSAVAPRMNEDRFTIGALVAAQAEGASEWQVGRVQRIERRPGDAAAVGVEIIARAPIAAEVTVDTPNGPADKPEVVILLAHPRNCEVGEALDALFRSGVNAAGQVYRFEYEGTCYRFGPEQLLARGTDYELLRLRRLED